MPDLLQSLPGEALVRQGLDDLRAGRDTIAACLARIAWRRLERAGFSIVTAAAPTQELELKLYRMLMSEGGDAYSRYNALLRELVSFEQALDRRIREAQARQGEATAPR